MAGPAAVPGVDPSRVSTPDELAACLDGLRRRRGLSQPELARLLDQPPSWVSQVERGLLPVDPMSLLGDVAGARHAIAAAAPRLRPPDRG